MQGLEPDHMTETFLARMPTPEELEELELPAGEPVVELHRTTYTADDVPVEFARGIQATNHGQRMSASAWVATTSA
jgi:GntR family transcriptional regulator